MTGPEYYFDERNPSDYRLFGVHFAILPIGASPPIAERLLACAGEYCLWLTGETGYVHTGTIIGVLAADRTDLGARSMSLLRGPLAERGAYMRIAYGRPDRVTRQLRATPRALRPPGTVTSEVDDLDRGATTATVRMNRPGVAVLSSSFDPGWTVTVDGRPRPTLIVAPALVATAVPAGTHIVGFRFRGRADYPELFALSFLTLAALLAVDVRRTSNARRITAGGRSRGSPMVARMM
jgi:hypothetical protein